MADVLDWRTPIVLANPNDDDRAALAWRTSGERLTEFAANCRRITNDTIKDWSTSERLLAAPVINATETAAACAHCQDGDPCHTLYVVRTAMDQLTTIISKRRAAAEACARDLEDSVRSMTKIPGVTPALLRMCRSSRWL